MARIIIKYCAMKKKSKQRVILKRFRDGGSLKFNAGEGSFGAVNGKSLQVEYIYGVIPLKIMKLGQDNLANLGGTAEIQPFVLIAQQRIRMKGFLFFRRKGDRL
jgi:hypothetical protein